MIQSEYILSVYGSINSIVAGGAVGIAVHPVHPANCLTVLQLNSDTK